jgi:O-antigen/teichoic acid export membrane protein
VKPNPISDFRSLIDNIPLKFQQSIYNWGFILLGLLAERIFTALALITFAKRVSPVEYGQYISSYSLVSFLIVIPGFGLDAWLLVRGKNNQSITKSMWRHSLSLRMKLLAGWFIVMLVIINFLPKETFPPAIIIISSLGLIFDSLLLLAFAAFRNLNQHGKITIYQSVSSGALLLFVYFVDLGNYETLYFACARTGLSIIFAILLYSSRSNDLRQNIDSISHKSILKEAQPFMFAELASVVYVRADLTIISLVLGAGASGIYGPAINILQLTFLLPRALFYLLVPILSRTYEKSIQTFLFRNIIQMIGQFSIGIVFSMILLFFSPAIINLVYDPSYITSSSILLLLSPIPLLRSLNFSLGATLATSDNQKNRTIVQVSTAIFNVIGNLLIVRRFGVAGVAVMYTLSELVLYLGYTITSLIWIKNIQK